MWKHYIYLHRHADSGEPFYVGKGKLRRSLAIYERAYETRSRGKHWMHVIAKHGLLVEIIAHCQTDEDAQHVERTLIAKIGRRDLGAGPLINRTDGGDGHAGIIASAELRAKRRLAAQSQRSDAWVAAIRAARKNGGNGGVVKRGDKLPEAWVKNLARAKVGELNPNYGRVSPRAKSVRCRESGVVYPSVQAAALAIGKPMQTVWQWLKGRSPNPTFLEYL